MKDENPFDKIDYRSEEQMKRERALSGKSQSAGSVFDRVAELEDAIVNIFKWTGGKRVARECRRVLPDVHERLDARQKPNVTHEFPCS